MSRPRGRCILCEAWCETREAPTFAGDESGLFAGVALFVVEHFPPTARTADGRAIAWGQASCTGSGRLPSRLGYPARGRAAEDP